MTIIKNAAKISYSEICNALKFDNENDFCFVPVEEKQEIKVSFNDYFPISKLLNLSNADEDVTTIKVDEENIIISLGQSFSVMDGTTTSFFADMEIILANYLIVTINNYGKKQTNDSFSKSKVIH